MAKHSNSEKRAVLDRMAHQQSSTSGGTITHKQARDRLIRTMKKIDQKGKL